MSYRTSFILRCWIDAKVRVRLIDVRTGVNYPVANLSDLPGLIRRLLAQRPPATKSCAGVTRPIIHLTGQGLEGGSVCANRDANQT